MGVAVAVILLITVSGCGAAIRTGHQENSLRLRPHAPSKGRGRLQVQIRRAFVGYHLLSSSQVYDYALARVRGDAWRRRHRWSVTRVLDQLCHRVGPHTRQAVAVAAIDRKHRLPLVHAS
jgi:hypothetical protein